MLGTLGALGMAHAMVLLHDAPEYVIGDMISPFKAVVGGGYKAVEQRLEAAIHLRFWLEPWASARAGRRIEAPPLLPRPAEPPSLN